ncbi:probable mitochondrial import inner membrane translocase subunit TIM21 [Triticum dicoccoides]|uniref:probable mitochondrial import inner membrane translocase subunit TIM21 n=1 Tax=Triticum dicoccoides TaxID=85692 RepID=UPI001890AAB2|nr:probable mitochondrial import inner membrane translocase subunit TIM21 [Triticum dicoccoides]
MQQSRGIGSCLGGRRGRTDGADLAAPRADAHPKQERRIASDFDVACSSLIFGKALARVQSDSQVTARIGYPITGYGNESRNRAARQRIPNRVWTDEDGVEHVEVNFYIRGPHGAGKVYSEMFKDNSDRTWKFMYLLVEFTAPLQGQVMLESYIPA